MVTFWATSVRRNHDRAEKAEVDVSLPYLIVGIGNSRSFLADSDDAEFNSGSELQTDIEQHPRAPAEWRLLSERQAQKRSSHVSSYSFRLPPVYHSQLSIRIGVASSFEIDTIEAETVGFDFDSPLARKSLQQYVVVVVVIAPVETLVAETQGPGTVSPDCAARKCCLRSRRLLAALLARNVRDPLSFHHVAAIGRISKRSSA